MTGDGHHHGHDNDNDDYDGDNDDGDSPEHGHGGSHDHNQEEKGHAGGNENKAFASAAGNLITGAQSTKPVNAKSDTKAGGPTVRVAPVSSPEPNEKNVAAAGAGLLLGVGLTDIIVKSINIVFPLFFLGMFPLFRESR